MAAHFIKLGDQVVALDMNRAGLASLADRPNLLPAVADVTDDAQMEKALAEASARFGLRRCLLTMPARPAARKRRPSTKPQPRWSTAWSM